MIEFFQYLNSLHPLSPEAAGDLMKVIRAKELRRGQVWLQEGAVCDKMTFVVKGLMKLYFETGSKEVALNFVKGNELMISAQSYFEHAPSRYIIRSVEQTVVIYIMRNDIQNVLEKHHELHLHLLLIAQLQIADLEYHTGLLMLSRKERFEKLKADRTWMTDGRMLSDKMLAGYLGMTANCLCGFKKTG